MYPQSLIALCVLAGAIIIGFAVAKLMDFIHDRKSLKDDGSDMSEYTRKILAQRVTVLFKNAVQDSEAPRKINPEESAKKMLRLWSAKAGRRARKKKEEAQSNGIEVNEDKVYSIMENGGSNSGAAPASPVLRHPQLDVINEQTDVDSNPDLGSESGKDKSKGNTLQVLSAKGLMGKSDKNGNDLGDSSDNDTNDPKGNDIVTQPEIHASDAPPTPTSETMPYEKGDPGKEIDSKLPSGEADSKGPKDSETEPGEQTQSIFPPVSTDGPVKSKTLERKISNISSSSGKPPIARKESTLSRKESNISFSGKTDIETHLSSSLGNLSIDTRKTSNQSSGIQSTRSTVGLSHVNLERTESLSSSINKSSSSSTLNESGRKSPDKPLTIVGNTSMTPISGGKSHSPIRTVEHSRPLSAISSRSKSPDKSTVASRSSTPKLGRKPSSSSLTGRRPSTGRSRPVSAASSHPRPTRPKSSSPAKKGRPKSSVDLSNKSKNTKL